MKKSRVVRRDELGEGVLEILGKFEDWFYPATVEESGRIFFMFLKWLEKNGYVIVKNDWNQL
jgi:hypothetical protein